MTDYRTQHDSFSHCLHYKVLDNIVDYYKTEEKFQSPYQIISYCFRPLSIEDIDHIDTPMTITNVLSSMTFEQMREKKITANDLLLWSASIDLIESYQSYLESSEEHSISQRYFYNCSTPWFGRYCQFTFNSTESFSEIVTQTFLGKNISTTSLTCFVLIECDRGPSPSCLDWREICDGTVDCINGIDEINCLELEINECKDDEYRCHQGMCIPEAFINDSPYNADCLDGSDENDYDRALQDISSGFRMNDYALATEYPHCSQDPSYRCEDTNHRLKSSFLFLHSVCGDGQPGAQFIPHKASNDVNNFGERYKCRNKRIEIFEQSLIDYAHHSELSYDCWFMMLCFTYIHIDDEIDFGCINFIDERDEYDRLPFDKKCNHSDYIIFPSYPVFDGHVRFGYWLNESFVYDGFSIQRTPDFICFDAQRCSFLTIDIILDDLTCISRSNLNIYFYEIPIFFKACDFMYKTGNETDCIHSSLFHCPNSTKCISKHRLLDGISDCYDAVDETYANSCELNQKHRFSCSSETKCISPYQVCDGTSQCLKKEDEDTRTQKEKIPFQKLCNDFESLPARNMSGETETDETNCHEWPCNNIYTRCDGAWSCPNGADELNCDRNSPCYPDRHECISINTLELECLPLNRAGNGLTDCLGSTDEREFCRRRFNTHELFYRCWNEDLCINVHDRKEWEWHCFRTDDCLNEKEFFFNQLSLDIGVYECTNKTGVLIRTTINKLEYDQVLLQNDNRNILYFSLERRNQFIAPKKTADPVVSTSNPVKIRSNSHCNRGILITFGQNKTDSCLCPPSYYGNRCQFQSERVSLTLQFNAKCAFNCQTIYTLILFLIDQINTIHSYDQATYTTTQNCDIKYHFNFLYKSRPKNLSNNYSIHIDIYKKVDLTYYMSWIIPIPHLFLPVNRLSSLVTIPSHPIEIIPEHSCQLNCGLNEQCRMYSNTGEYFCQRIARQDECNCSPSSTSKCLGRINNRSICLCPLDRFGPRCYLSSICQINPCLNGGQCIPGNEYLSTDDFICICPEGYFGRLCKQTNMRIDLSFGNIDIPQVILVHIVTVRTNSDPLITSILKRIPIYDNTITVHTPIEYNIILVEIENKYYMTFVQTKATNIPLNTIQIQSTAYCQSVFDGLNASLAKSPLLRRVKFYHSLCRNDHRLRCIHDHEAFMCLCDEERFANCFHFNFQTNSTCSNHEQCENDGHCQVNTPICPDSIMCVCKQCYYGSKCQLTTKGSSLSLDVILGYHIRPYVSISRQTLPVKISFTLTILFFVIGFINGLCSIITFHSKHIREVGCGLYLYILSIISFIILILFTLKFCFLMFFQTAFITNRRTQKISCISMDFLVQSAVTIQYWLSICVSIERIRVATRASNRTRKDTLKIARWTIPSIILFVFISFIHDPLNRELIDDEDDHRRTWCIIRYSSATKIYDSIIRIIHFLIPFAVNLVCALIIIISVARIHSNARQKKTFKQYLREEFNEHKHLIISPISLVILALPRLIVSFLTGCMKSIRYPWLFLSAYFISFLPSFLTLVTFILPSKTYKDQFKTNVGKIFQLIKQKRIL